jgi:hypothetical protein
LFEHFTNYKGTITSLKNIYGGPDKGRCVVFLLHSYVCLAALITFVTVMDETLNVILVSHFAPAFTVAGMYSGYSVSHPPVELLNHIGHNAVLTSYGVASITNCREIIV